jgi:integrase
MVHREMNVLSVGEVRSLLESVAGDRFEGVYFLALTTAMREGEIFALRWQDIDLEQGTVQVRMGVQEVFIQGKKRFDIRETKTVYSRRKIGLTKATIEVLKRHLARQEEASQALGEVWKNTYNLVFPNAVGGLMISHNFVRRNYKRLLTRLGISSRVRFHDLRHTCATLLLSRGVNVKVVSEMLGHSDIGITLRVYAHVLPHMQQSAVQEMEAMLGWD